MTVAPPKVSPVAPASGETPALDLTDVGYAFGRTVALDGVSFRCRRGTVHTVLGENGSGKSTLVKVISGVLRPLQGTVTIGAEPLKPVSPRRARGLGVATVFQEVLVAPTLNVEQNVMLGRDGWLTRSEPRTGRADRIREVLGEISAHSFDLKRKVGELDLVRRHQVAIARALLIQPDVLVLDESTAALDVSERDLLFEAVRRRVKEGMAVVFISHRLEEVLGLSDEVTVLSSGQKVATLESEEILEPRLLDLLNPERAHR